MKNKFSILMFIFFFSSIFSSSQGIDYKNCSKIEFINKLIDNPDDIRNIIKNSVFYSEKIFSMDLTGLLYPEESIKKTLRLFKGQCVLTNEVTLSSSSNVLINGIEQITPTEDIYTLNYLGQNLDLFPYLTIKFKFYEGNWYLQNIVYFSGSTKIFSVQDSNYYKNFYIDSPSKIRYYRTSSIIDKQNLPYINFNYQSCEKYQFIREILNNPNKLDSQLKFSNFTKNNPVFVKNFDSSYNIMKEYLLEYKFRMLEFNYPFPVHNQNILPYIEGYNPKDYFIIMFCNLPNLSYVVHVSIEFEKFKTGWKLVNIKRGTEICLGLNPQEFIPPQK